MRQIKFRGKRLDNGEWVVGDLLHIAGGCLIYFGSDSETAEPDLEKSSLIAVEFFKDEIAVVDPDTVGQFTNHHDRKGNEIYEGDIILSNGKYPYTVEWITDGFIMRGQIYGGITSIMSFLPNQREVIGNIHDNPELLNEK